MDEDRPALSAVQLEIMNLVWTQGETTVARVWRELFKRRGVSRNTVGTLMQRLVEKGWLTFRAEGNAHHFQAAVPRDQNASVLATKLVDTVFAGSVEGLVMTLLENRKLSPAEAARIRQLINDAEERA
jgi:BlaI family transcriptional regulator, penicillinase repressor